MRGGIVAVLTLGLFLAREASAQLLDGIAAIVNTNIITFSEVREMIRPLERDLQRAYRGEELSQKIQAAALDALNTLVERALIIQEFNTKQYKIPESYIEERIREIIRQDFGGDRQLLLRTLNAQGLTMQQYRERLRNQVIVQAMKHQQVTGEIIISPARIEKYYRERQDDFRVDDQIKLRMLMVRKGVDAEDTAARRALAEEILARLDAGEDFGELARQYSEGSHNKEERGNWGWIDRDTLKEELSRAAFALKPGQYSRLVETEDGFYLLKVEDFKPAHVRPLAEVRAEIESRLISEERQRRQQAWIDRLKARAYIRYF